MNIQKNDIVTLDITDMNNLGAGVGKLDGAVFFVNGAVVGDKIQAKVIKVTKNYYVARVEKIISPSDMRACTEFCSAPASCGGCVYRYITRECELDMKKRHVEGLFLKANLSDINILPPLVVSERYGYRNKAQYPVKNTKNGLRAGFYAGKTHEIVTSESCSLEPDIFANIVRSVCKFATDHSVLAYEEESGRGLLRHIYLRRGEVTNEIMLCLVINGDKLPYADEFVKYITEKHKEIKSLMLNINKKNTNVVLGKEYKLLYGKGYIEDKLCGLDFKISPDSFWQVNRVGAEKLYGVAKEMANLCGNERLLDLYCGTGTIGLSMADKVHSLTGIEIVQSAVDCAKENAANNNITNAEFFCADASDIESMIPNDRKFDVVILDPPRKGTTRELINYIAKRDIKRVVYISCGPDTLARDIGIFKEYGYNASDVQIVDMFPATGHVESVCLLSKQ